MHLFKLLNFLFYALVVFAVKENKIAASKLTNGKLNLKSNLYDPITGLPDDIDPLLEAQFESLPSYKASKVARRIIRRRSLSTF